ncbi:5-(carboxyamino)imidazole ribonucleotide synthase [Colwellia hornerae]|uniref:N5-carboxyaminoimidazole ribonucleotide synthase n=1 Tax=Colwellia hornerae TaxID=89402 RepID=A0A5C6QRB7_9GAMM|nr:5-(carboxyamino)imidazole ribonucleotide synthase [Colwellia hornerae]TWX57717.1 5-(carboxyamino)imidazole ribonucleotide synthase [Colwellia hornerae]TWX62552.1 5-(carboxyamino)imidazole ribonucleotide synthase [Colwellia hornerae]TWX71464.1 5-(carboxyamino)imidazole ribonucleotide synthase [Colwellia hornerae]
MRIAIVGCGQLSRMLALAGLPLGIKFSFINDNYQQATDCVDGLGRVVPLTKDWQEEQNIHNLYNRLGKPDLITVEKEQVDIKLLKALQAHCDILPNIEAIAACQHRYREKQLLEKLAIPTSPFAYSLPANEALKVLQLPMVVKSCRDGYDGKNQWVLKTLADIEDFDRLNIQDYIIEAWIKFEREVSLVSVRSKSGDIEHYALTDNIHENGILLQSIAPAIDQNNTLTIKAHTYMEAILNAVDYVGVMAMECFVVNDELIINELAPRVHNSGHWTQAGSVTCQFENHIRAVAGLVLGSTASLGTTGMINLIGNEQPPLSSLSVLSTLHWYNKLVKAQRKLGHVNFFDKDQVSLVQQMDDFQCAIKLNNIS